VVQAREADLRAARRDDGEQRLWKGREKRRLATTTTSWAERTGGARAFDAEVDILQDVRERLRVLEEELDGRKDDAAVGVLEAVVDVVLRTK
jgi:hypothetical protein